MEEFYRKGTLKMLVYSPGDTITVAPAAALIKERLRYGRFTMICIDLL